MDNVTLFKKILSDLGEDKSLDKAFKANFDVTATLPQLGCRADDFKKMPFTNTSESFRDVQSLLCTCGGIQPEIAKSAYDCLKSFENDENAFSNCKSQVDAVRSTVSSLIEKIGQDNERVSNIMRTCNPKRNATHSLDNISQFHACFMPEACGTYLSRVLTCVNKNNQEMAGCEKEIEEMVKCGIDKFHQPLAKTINLKNDEESVIEAMSDVTSKKVVELDSILKRYN